MDKRFLSDHLFLLVGGNPLPNAVVGKLLAAPNGTITLIHSRETADIAQRLHTWLSGQRVPHLELKEIEESDSTSIFRGVRERMEKIKSQCIGLNYTGGTKAMSVHSYRAVERWAQEHSIASVFSYLDARELKVVFDPADPASGKHGHAEYVGRAVELKLVDLLQLHGWTLKHEPNTEPVLPRSASALVAACINDDTFNDWKRWIHDELRAKCRRPGKDEWKSKTALCSITLNVPSSSTLSEVVQALQDELDHIEGDIALNQLPPGIEAKDFCEWLDGKWLEHHVLRVLSNLPASLSLHQCAQNIETHEVQFDVDAIALCGYQLFAFSCSTDTGKSLLKSKLFEAYIRARQLGGDEARVALVCCSNDPDWLEHEMRRDVDPAGRIRVFGRMHLADLAAHIEQWIKSQSGEK